jgi:uncharacterized membrane protein YfhO
MSSSIYAEQINSAHIQGQAAAREKATRARQEALKKEQTMIKGLEESANTNVREREARQQYAEQQPEDSEQDAAEDRENENPGKEGGTFGHIDLTA